MYHCWWFQNGFIFANWNRIECRRAFAKMTCSNLLRYVRILMWQCVRRCCLNLVRIILVTYPMRYYVRDVLYCGRNIWLGCWVHPIPTTIKPTLAVHRHCQLPYLLTAFLLHPASWWCQKVQRESSNHLMIDTIGRSIVGACAPIKYRFISYSIEVSV